MKKNSKEFKRNKIKLRKLKNRKKRKFEIPKIITEQKKQTMVQICRLQNIEHKSMNKFLIVVNIPSQLI